MTEYDISQTIDGEWRTPPRHNFYRACCDCGLVHREEYRVHQGHIQYRVWRDVEETALERARIKGSDAMNAQELFARMWIACDPNRGGSGLHPDDIMTDAHGDLKNQPRWKWFVPRAEAAIRFLNEHGYRLEKK